MLVTREPIIGSLFLCQIFCVAHRFGIAALREREVRTKWQRFEFLPVNELGPADPGAGASMERTWPICVASAAFSMPCHCRVTRNNVLRSLPPSIQGKHPRSSELSAAPGPLPGRARTVCWERQRTTQPLAHPDRSHQERHHPGSPRRGVQTGCHRRQCRKPSGAGHGIQPGSRWYCRG
jgi:hypothetical protein